MKLSQNLLTSISFVVNEKPPYKQAPTDAAEQKSQAQRKEFCQQEAWKAFAGHDVLIELLGFHTLSTEQCLVIGIKSL